MGHAAANGYPPESLAVVHELHLLTLAGGGRIIGGTMFCGGRWSAALLAEMEEADG